MTNTAALAGGADPSAPQWEAASRQASGEPGKRGHRAQREPDRLAGQRKGSMGLGPAKRSPMALMAIP